MSEQPSGPAPSSIRGKATDPFGEVEPMAPGDERPDSWGDADDDRDAELLREVPPHHG